MGTKFRAKVVIPACLGYPHLTDWTKYQCLQHKCPLHQNKKQVPPRLATVGRCFVPCTYCGRGQIAATSAAMSTCEPVLDRLALPVHIVPHHQHTQKPWVHWCGHSALIGVAGCARRMRNQQKGTFLLLCLFLSFTSLSQFFYRELMW